MLQPLLLPSSSKAWAAMNVCATPVIHVVTPTTFSFPSEDLDLTSFSFVLSISLIVLTIFLASDDLNSSTNFPSVSLLEIFVNIQMGYFVEVNESQIVD